jgi:hypothetical protein
VLDIEGRERHILKVFGWITDSISNYGSAAGLYECL